jgi:hypothetical protein
VLRFRFRRTRPKASVSSLRYRLGEPSRRRSRILEARGLRCGGRWPKPRSVTARSHKWRRAREHRSELHLPRAEARERCFLEAWTVAEAKVWAPKPPFWMHTAEAVSAREGPFEGLGSGSFRRSGSSRDRRLEGCLPPARHRSGPQVQDTQRECDDVSLGVRFLSAYEPRRSLCRFAFPTRSAHGVSHSLSGLSPPGPCGFVSRHIHL